MTHFLLGVGVALTTVLGSAALVILASRVSLSVQDRRYRGELRP